MNELIDPSEETTDTPAPDVQEPQDGSRPLADPEKETFAQLRSSGIPGVEAYRQARGCRIRYANAKSQASRWVRLPEVAARVRWLLAQAAERRRTAQDRPQTQPPTTPTFSHQPNPGPGDPPRPPASGAIDRNGLILKLSQAVEDGSTSEIVQAAGALLKLMPELTAQKSDAPDPLQVVEYLSHAAGRPGREIAAELGGAVFLVKRLCQTCRIPLSDLPTIAAELAQGPQADQDQQETPTA